MAHGGNFSGIYKKVQLKPLKWDGEGEEERPVEALMILKYGGVLTHAGERTGLLRLHSTYRHALKFTALTKDVFSNPTCKGFRFFFVNLVD
ncbi:hypothetical protein YC2023_049217 [Brassica napus]